MGEALPTETVGVPRVLPVSDDSLVERARAGDEAAYAELFSRHRAVATRVARRLAGSDRADDLVSEAFTKVWRLLREGKGPETGFRSYLLTTVRNEHLSTVRRQRREALTADYAELGDDLAFEEDHQARIDASNVGRAFRALPDRWRRVLWLSAVERRDHAEIAGTLGITPNAVGVLAFRAREGLRETYLSEHLLTSSDRSCRDAIRLLPGYVRGTLTARRRTRVDSHLDGCARCSAALVDLESINLELGALLLVALPGLSEAGALSASGTIATTHSTGVLGAKAAVAAGLAATIAGIAAGYAGLTSAPPDPPTTMQVAARPAEDLTWRPAPSHPSGEDRSGEAAASPDIGQSGAPAPTAPTAPMAPPAPTAPLPPTANEPRAPRPPRTTDSLLGSPPLPAPPPAGPDAGVAPREPEPLPTTEPVLAPRLGTPQVSADLAGTRATVTVLVTDLSPGDSVRLTAVHTLSAATPSQDGWSCKVSADWLDGHLWATHTVSCTWTGAAGATAPLVSQYGLLGTGSLTATLTAAKDADLADNTTTATLG